jgi:hypothetical protein
MVISRIPLEPLPPQRRNEIFLKLLKLDRGIVSGNSKLTLTKTETMDFLVVIRGALIRYGNVAGKTVLEVSNSSVLTPGHGDDSGVILTL